ncbi:hypothetical protein EJB05_20995, partial [Eragrostis curvula]
MSICQVEHFLTTFLDHLLWKSHTFIWSQRMTIFSDIARGLEYIHNFSVENFIHRDIKASNVLLDHNLRAKVSDFGLVKPAKDADKLVTSTFARTFGYLAPECSIQLPEERLSMTHYLSYQNYRVPIFRNSVVDKNLFKIVDPRLHLSNEAWNNLLQVAYLAHQCTATEPSGRPDMNECFSWLTRVG